jgi:erythromycin esterase
MASTSWPWRVTGRTAGRVNAFVRGLDGAASTPRDVLEGFERWPTWMWANTDVEGFIGWLRDRNAALPAPERVGFYGFDVYSLWESLEAALGYLAEHEPETVGAAHEALRCFAPYGQDPQAYASATRIVPVSCEEEVIALLTRICEGRVQPDGAQPQARFAAEQNAAVARNAERYRARRQGHRLGAQLPHRRRPVHRHGCRPPGQRRAARARATR